MSTISLSPLPGQDYSRTQASAEVAVDDFQNDKPFILGAAFIDGSSPWTRFSLLARLLELSGESAEVIIYTWDKSEVIRFDLTREAEE